MRKKVNTIRHLSVLFLTIMIFVIGILIGGNVEQLRVQNLYTQLQEQDLDFQNLVTQETYIDYLATSKNQGENISCETIKSTYYTSIENLDDSRLKLEGYINKGNVKEEEFNRLKEHYSNLQINYWILANRINNICEETNMNPILYFYAEDKKCPACEDQGVHLTYVKQKLGDNVLIFSLDSEKIGAISLLAKNYDIYNRELPAIIINEQIYDYKTNDEVFQLLCENGLDNNEVCSE